MPKIKYKDKNFASYLLSYRLIVLASNVVFQGIRYMSLGERLYKISITVFFAILINFVIDNFFISFIIGHLFNYILNGQFYVVFRYLSSKQVMSRVHLDKYIKIIERNIATFKPLDVLATGSFCRGEMSRHSDLDLRIYHSNDFISSLRAYIMATTLRFIGLWKRFPIDVYCCSDLVFFDKLDKIEIPVNFLQNVEFLEKYPTSSNYKIHIEGLILK